MNQTEYCTEVASPIGTLLLTSDGASLTGLFTNGYKPPTPLRRDDELPIFDRAREQIAAYFDGRLTDFDLPIAPEGTAFQKTVWSELCNIPYGQTISYGELAKRIGNPNASRAVGLANGRNPISIIVPCHRVIGADGSLTGYGGGLPIKQALLELESPNLFAR